MAASQWLAATSVSQYIFVCISPRLLPITFFW
jgi:hypothetical protein